MRPSDIRYAYDKAFVEAVRRKINFKDKISETIFELEYGDDKHSADQIAAKLNLSIYTVYKRKSILNKKLAKVDIAECEEVAKAIRLENKQKIMKAIENDGKS